jgi:general secretion pathway protein F
MLLKLADFYALDAEVTLKRLVALVEPALIITVSLFAAVVVISLLSAVLGINAIVV